MDFTLLSFVPMLSARLSTVVSARVQIHIKMDMISCQFQQQDMTAVQWQSHQALHFENSTAPCDDALRISRYYIPSMALSGPCFVDEGIICMMDGKTASRQRKPSRRRSQHTDKSSTISLLYPSSSSLGCWVSCLLFWPLWMNEHDSDSLIEFQEEMAAPVSILLPLMTAIALTWIFTSMSSHYIPSSSTSTAPLAAKMVLWYGLTVVAALHICQAMDASTWVLSSFATVACWIIGGWHSFEMKKSQAVQQHQIQQRCLPTPSFHSMINGVSRASLLLLLPVAVVSLGLPHMLTNLLRNILSQQNEDSLWLQDLDELPARDYLVTCIRVFGVCQLSMAAMIVQWRDDMLIHGEISAHKKYITYLPLIQLLLASLPAYALGTMLSFERDDISILVGHCVMLMAVTGMSAWIAERLTMVA